MQGAWRKCARVAGLVGMWMVLQGCGPEPTPVGPAAKAASGGPETNAVVAFPADVWSVVQERCVWCHTPQNPTGGFDFTQRTQTLATVREIGYAVQQEMAPLVVRLPAAEKRTILNWVAAATGPWPQVQVPASYHWELQNVIAGLPDGAPVPGFAFAVEDGWIDSRPWTVATYTDRFGIRFKGVALAQSRFTDSRIFSSSRNPSSYLVFKGVPWHGRFHDMRMEGDVRVNRWISVGMQARDMQPSGRGRRDYVRLQFDRDAISLRSAPTVTETWPWGGSGAVPGADGKLTGNLNASGFYQRNDEWLHFVLTSARVPEGVRWNALVTRRGTGAVVASLQALQRTTEPLGGVFFLHAYGVGSQRNWANLVFDAQVDGDPVSAPPPVPPAPRPVPPQRVPDEQTPGPLAVRPNG